MSFSPNHTKGLWETSRFTMLKESTLLFSSAFFEFQKKHHAEPVRSRQIVIVCFAQFFNFCSSARCLVNQKLSVHILFSARYRHQECISLTQLDVVLKIDREKEREKERDIERERQRDVNTRTTSMGGGEVKSRPLFSTTFPICFSIFYFVNCI